MRLARHARLSNAEVADLLERVADLLRAQAAGPHRERAWRDAAAVVRDLDRPVWELAREGGRPALQALPRIGRGLAGAIEDLVRTGRLRALDRLEGETAPEDLFTTVPGIGHDLAERIHRHLGIESLPDLEVAAHDGRLEHVPGFGPRRAAAIRDLLAARLSRRVHARATGPGLVAPRQATPPRPDVGVLLDVDEEYRRRADAGELPTIAPRRFNPERRRWLPILHTHRGGWDFTALYSNTARAHALGRTHDWVVIFYSRDGDDGQCTVVTETRGALAGTRIVRGREAASWSALGTAPPAAFASQPARGS